MKSYGLRLADNVINCRHTWLEIIDVHINTEKFEGQFYKQKSSNVYVLSALSKNFVRKFPLYMQVSIFLWLTNVPLYFIVFSSLLTFLGNL